MTKRTLIHVLLVLLALAGAALLVAFARGVGAVERELSALDSRDQRLALAQDPGLPAFGPADRLARDLLGLGDDIELRRAVGLIEESRRFSHIPNQTLELQAQAIALLQQIDGEPRDRASRAATLIGALYVEAETLDPDAASRYRQQATEAFQTAARLDPTNEAAKLGLELILAGPSAATLRAGEEGSGGGVTGAGESPPGSGY